VTLHLGDRLGRYELQALLGAGGMGEVYRAFDTRLNRTVAIKVLRPALASDTRFRERFEREARAVASLNHSNICGVYDVGENPSATYLVMEFLEGTTLDRYLQSHRLQTADVVAMGVQIAAGIEAAHAKGIVHRDIKPGNVFVTADGTIKITDFGLATVTALAAPAQSIAETAVGNLTMPGSSVGTAAYMSPEQARGEPVDARTDIFAFGTVLYEMATGRPAFSGATLATVFDAVLNQTPSSASSVAPRVPASLSDIIGRALEKNRDRRYQRIADVRVDLERVASGASASAASTPLPVVSDRGVRPGSRSIAAIAALAVLVVGLAAGVWYFARSQPSATVVSAPPIRALAVLPLDNLSNGTDNDYFTTGMTDELITALAGIRGWRVISRTSVMQYKGTRKPLPVIARELGVDAIVEGSIQQTASRVRITAKLVRAVPTEENLWADSFDRDLKDVLDLQTDVARAISNEIKVTLTPQEQQRLAVRRPVDPEVFQLFLKGRAASDEGTEDGFLKAISYFDQALAVKPDDAAAHAAMALAYENLTPAFRAPKEVLPKARAHAVRAIELDPSLSDAHAALAAVMFYFDWDWANAEKEMQRAIDLNPNSSSAHEMYGNYLSALPRKDASIAELELAHQLNPAGLATYASLLGGLTTLREYDRAIAESRRALELHPDFAFAYAWMGMALLMKGDAKGALAPLQRARMLDDNVTTTHFLAMAQAAAGNRSEAERLVAGLEKVAATRYTCAYEVASVHLRLGNTKKAMEWLGRGVEEQCDCLVWLKTEPWVDPLRVDPRYADLVKRVGFPDR
jgi:serine/threonine-protein kinase